MFSSAERTDTSMAGIAADQIKEIHSNIDPENTSVAHASEANAPELIKSSIAEDIASSILGKRKDNMPHSTMFDQFLVSFLGLCDTPSAPRVSDLPHSRSFLWLLNLQCCLHGM